MITRSYEMQVSKELKVWQKKMLRRPSLFVNMSRRIQAKINNRIPEKVHVAITVAIKQMLRAVLFGSKLTTSSGLKNVSLKQREAAVRRKINIYRRTAAVEGGITGAGGILLGLADFPILVGIKIKLLFDIASLYGFDVKDYKERIYLLHIFELAFSSAVHRRKVYLQMINWNEQENNLPKDIHQFDWRNFQQEYRDYLDIAKMAQMIPLIGAPVGIWINNKLVKKLGRTAMNAYRMRLLNNVMKS